MTYINSSFAYSCTNGFIEGCNYKVSVLKRNDYGYRNFKRFRNRILHIFLIKNYLRICNSKPLMHFPIFSYPLLTKRQNFRLSQNERTKGPKHLKYTRNGNLSLNIIGIFRISYYKKVQSLFFVLNCFDFNIHLKFRLCTLNPHWKGNYNMTSLVALTGRFQFHQVIYFKFYCAPFSKSLRIISQVE